jgi:hypothetical protein
MWKDQELRYHLLGNQIKIKKVNIRIEEALKLTNVEDYKDVATIDKIIDLLHESIRTTFQTSSLR